jgi:alkanesulfonate monooxygenase SsuD/methylene tetrahydromethanopterin reductase-like flavin-dependent oxidoreductase (luciferase family)
VIAGLNVVASERADEAHHRLQAAKRARVKVLFKGTSHLDDDELDTILDSPAGRSVDDMLRYTAIGTPDEVRDQLDRFAAHAQADELIIALADTRREDALHTLDLVARIHEPIAG